MDRELLWNMEEFEVDEEFGVNDLIETLRQYCHGDKLLISTDKSDWMGRPGYKTVDMNRSNEEIFADIVPTYECSFGLYKDGDEIYAIVSSHDIPTGAKWNFKGVEDKEDEN